MCLNSFMVLCAYASALIHNSRLIMLMVLPDTVP